MRVEVTQGETIQDSFRIRNDGLETLALSLEVEGLEDYILLSDKSIVLNKGETKGINVKFVALAEQEPKSYIGKIIVKTALVKKELPLVMTVKKREALFDVKVEIPEKFKTVYPGEGVVADITLLNIGKIGQVDVDVYYAIKNPQGTVITFSKETVGVEVATSFTKTLTLPEDVATGNHTYFVNITYKDTSTTGEDYFIVKSKISYIPTIIQKRLVEILVWVFGAGLLLLAYFLFRERLKEKYLEKKEKELEKRVSKIEKKKKK